MTGPIPLAQAAEDTSSAAAPVFGILLLVAIVSFLALTRRGQRSLLPVVSILLGLLVGVSTVATVSSFSQAISPITLLGLFIALLLLVGGIGALREGVQLPEIEGEEPDVPPAPPRRTPDSL